MNIFEDIGLTWEGKEYVVPSDRVMGLVATVEDAITIEELCAQGVKRAKVAKAFSNALRYAGCPASQEEVYSKLFGAENAMHVTSIINSLLVMMIPPEHLQQKKTATPAKKVATRSKKSPTA